MLFGQVRLFARSRCLEPSPRSFASLRPGGQVIAHRNRRTWAWGAAVAAASVVAGGWTFQTKSNQSTNVCVCASTPTAIGVPLPASQPARRNKLRNTGTYNDMLGPPLFPTVHVVFVQNESINI